MPNVARCKPGGYILKEGFMLKKSLIFGTVALFLTALVAFTGCTQATDSDTTSSGEGRNSVYGSIDVFGLQEVIDKAVAANEPIYLEDGLKITSVEGITPDPDDVWENTINFRTATVRINGNVGVSSGTKVHFNIAQAKVSGTGILSTGNGDLIAQFNQPGNQLFYLGAGSLAGERVEFGRPLDSAQWTSQKVAVSEFKYGASPGYDYSTGVAIAPTAPIEKIYVLDKVTIPSTSNIGEPTIAVVAFGKVDVVGTETGLIAQTYPSAAESRFKLGTSSTLTATAGSADISIPSKQYSVNSNNINISMIPNIDVETAYPISLKVNTGSSDGLFFTNTLSGAGKLTLSDAFASGIQINGGNGNVVFSNTTGLSLEGTLAAKNTGTTVFNKKLELKANDNEIGGAVTFKEGVSLTGEDLTLNGNVTLFNAQSTAAGVPFSIEFAENSIVQLAKDKSILVGGGLYAGSNVTAIIDPVSIFTAVDAALVLTAVDDDAQFIAPNALAATAKPATQLHLNGAITIDSGTLRVDSTLGILDDAVITITDIPNRVRGAIALAPDASLVLAGDGYTLNTIGVTTNPADTSSGKIELGATAYIKAPMTVKPAILTAVGGTIILKEDTISSADKATLRGTDAIASFVTNGELALDGVTLDITSLGALLFENAEKTVKLTNNAGVIFVTGGIADEQTIIQVGSTAANRADVTNAIVTASVKKLASVAHNGGVAPATIKSRVASLNLSKSNTNLTK
jgi:hypothetical protein